MGSEKAPPPQWLCNSDKAKLHLSQGDVLDLYPQWPNPTVIISDGAYGIKGFAGDLVSSTGLADWYQPHIKAWTRAATPQTTLWFWCTELGWATVHPHLEAAGWEYRSCHTWDKGLAHAAGNTNSQSLRKLPVVTEVCVQYVKRPVFCVEGRTLSTQAWLRYEWQRSGLPFSKANEACGVKNAASRKYFTPDHLWYFPPPEAFGRLVDYANTFGKPEGRPYFAVEGQSLTAVQWETYRAKFHCPLGVTNVWQESPVNGQERLKTGKKALHYNQKPLRLMERLVQMSSDEGDCIWEPFGGLCTASLAAYKLGRSAWAAEIKAPIYQAALERLQREVSLLQQTPLWQAS
jgi:site-specific DNA-methyltransferase (adenine-specific)